MTPSQRRWARSFLAVSLFICWDIHYQMSASVPPSSNALLAAALAIIGSPLTRLLLIPAWLLLAWNGSLWAYAAAALCAAGANWTLFLLDPSHIEHAVVMPEALCLLMFLVLLLRRGAAAAEDEAWELGCALIGAMYFLSGVEKLRQTGFSWTTGETVRALVASSSIHSNGWLRAVRWGFASNPLVGRFVSIFTLVVELLCAPAFAFRRTRPWAGAAIVSMHAGVLLMSGIAWSLFSLVVAALSFPRARSASE